MLKVIRALATAARETNISHYQKNALTRRLGWARTKKRRPCRASFKYCFYVLGRGFMVFEFRQALFVVF